MPHFGVFLPLQRIFQTVSFCGFMTSATLHQQAAPFLKSRPDVRPGYTVRVYERIQEGGKERLQAFEGLVIAVHKGHTPADHTITVRRIASGVGVEKIYSLHSPQIDRIEVKKVAKIRRAKLFFLRGRRGKAARLSERFTTSDEFAVAAAASVDEAVETTMEEGIADESNVEKAETQPEAPVEPMEEATVDVESEEKKDEASAA